MNFSKGRLYLQKGKSRVQNFAAKQDCVFALFGKNVDELRISESVEAGYLPLLECTGEEVGYWIHKSRERGFSDEKIYDTLVNTRDSYMKKENLNECDFASRKMSRQIYEAVRDGVEGLCS